MEWIQQDSFPKGDMYTNHPQGLYRATSHEEYESLDQIYACTPELQLYTEDKQYITNADASNPDLSLALYHASNSCTASAAAWQ